MNDMSMKTNKHFSNLLIGLALALFIFNFHKFFTDHLLKSNVLSMLQRATFLNESSSVSRRWIAKNLIDEKNLKAWHSNKDSPYPHVFVFELAGPVKIDVLKFKNQQEQGEKPRMAAKDIKVEFSTKSPDSAYKSIGTFSLRLCDTLQEFKIQKEKARWIRLSILSNYGNPNFTEFSQIEAWGVFDFSLFRIFSNFLWVFGIVVIITALSYHEFLAYTKKEKIKDVMKRGWHKNVYYLGAIFIIFGFIASIQNIWLYMSLGAVCFSFLIWFLKFRPSS